MAKKVLVIGGGVSGLTCGVVLLERQYEVTIIADRFTPDTTSDAAAAIWYPYKAYPEDKVTAWGKTTFDKYLELLEVPEAGISLVEIVDLFDHEVEEPWWRDAVPSFRHGSPAELPPGYLDAYIVEVPLIETPVHMQYLTDRFIGLGGELQKLEKPVSSLNDLAPEHPLIVNCTGIGAFHLCNDDQVYPIRGQVVRTTNPGLKNSIVDETGPLGISYIIPRSSDCILGGTADENDWSLEEDTETSMRIINNCRQLEPALHQAEILNHKVGLRPGRREVRLEPEQLTHKCRVIHNYGHGGAGFTLAWGCAREVAALVIDAY